MKQVVATIADVLASLHESIDHVQYFTLAKLLSG